MPRRFRRFPTRRFGSSRGLRRFKNSLILDKFTTSLDMGPTTTQQGNAMSLVERDDWQAVVTETIQRRGIVKQILVDATASCTAFVAGGTALAGFANFIWVLAVFSAEDPEFVAPAGNWWTPGQLWANGRTRILRTGTFGFQWLTTTVAGNTMPVASPPVRVRATWRGGAKVGFDDNVWFIVWKDSPTGDQSTLASVTMTTTTRAYVRVMQ